MKPLLCVCVLLAVTASQAHAADLARQELAVDITSDNLRVVVDATVNTPLGETALMVYALSLPLNVFTVNGVPAQLRAVPGTSEAVEIPLDVGTPAAAGVTQVHLEMEGRLLCDQAGRVACVQSAQDTALLPSFAGPGWYLQTALQADPFELSIAVTASAEREVVAGAGAPLEVTAAVGGVRTWTYGFPIPAEMVMVYARPNIKVTSQEGFEVLGFAPDRTATRAKMQVAVDLAGALLPIYGQMLGNYPGTRAHLMAMPRNFFAGGIGLMGNVLFGEFVVDDLDYLLEQGTAHELGHTWWGSLASAPATSPHGGFMQEAFAEYTAWLGMGRLKGEATRTSGVRMNATWYMYRRPSGRDLAVLDENVGTSSLYVFVTYHKASVVLRALEEAVGQETFLRALRALQARGPGGLTPEAFLDVLGTEAGAAARSRAEAWLNTEGFPSLVMSTTRQRLSQGERVSVAISRVGAAPVLLPLHFVLEGGERVSRVVEITQDDTTVDVDLPGMLVALEADPTWTMPREVAPALQGDVTLDGVVDAADVMEVVFRQGAYLPSTRREDGAYDSLYDVNLDRLINADDVDQVAVLAGG
jgi:hypothetical protein